MKSSVMIAKSQAAGRAQKDRDEAGVHRGGLGVPENAAVSHGSAPGGARVLPHCPQAGQSSTGSGGMDARAYLRVSKAISGSHPLPAPRYDTVSDAITRIAGHAGPADENGSAWRRAGGPRRSPGYSDQNIRQRSFMGGMQAEENCPCRMSLQTCHH